MPDKDLRLNRLTPQRRQMVIDAIGGVTLDISNGKFSKPSHSTLDKIGLTEHEIDAIAQDNTDTSAEFGYYVVPHPEASSENNPWKKDKWNPGIQRIVADSDPALTQRLLREAGMIA